MKNLLQILASVLIMTAFAAALEYGLYKQEGRDCMQWQIEGAVRNGLYLITKSQKEQCAEHHIFINSVVI